LIGDPGVATLSPAIIASNAYTIRKIQDIGAVNAAADKYRRNNSVP
jgi:hypothetical protein